MEDLLYVIDLHLVRGNKPEGLHEVDLKVLDKKGLELINNSLFDSGVNVLGGDVLTRFVEAA